MDTFLEEIGRHKDAFYRFVYRTLWEPSLADDVFAEAVLAAYENLDRFTPGTNFRAWMFRILANKCFVANRYAARNRYSLSELSEEDACLAVDDGKTPARWCDDMLEMCGEEVYQAFHQLSPMQRMCILLKDVEEFSYKEIAEMLEIPEPTVMTHIARGRKKLRRLLSAYAVQRGILTEGKAETQEAFTSVKPPCSVSGEVSAAAAQV